MERTSPLSRSDEVQDARRANGGADVATLTATAAQHVRFPVHLSRRIITSALPIPILRPRMENWAVA